METPSRIEPCLLDTVPTPIADLIAEIGKAGAVLGHGLHPRSAQSAADLVALMNCYYSNLIEGHHTQPRDIERALNDDLETDPQRRDLQVEARAHVRVQRSIDRLFAEGKLGDPTTPYFICWLHREFYKDAPPAFLHIKGTGGQVLHMVPGQFRTTAAHDNVVGFHHPPSSEVVSAFMDHFHQRYRVDRLGSGQSIIAIAAAHHRFNYIHPFLDGNGRVSRLVSHAMALNAGVGAHGLWSISRGLARGLQDRSDYKRMMNRADAPRENDYDGRGNLSQRALIEFVTWFLQVLLDQMRFMKELLDLETLAQRLHHYVAEVLGMAPQAASMVAEVFRRGTIPRGEAARLTGRAERRGREIMRTLIEHGLLASETPKSEVYVNFTAASAAHLFPLLFPASE